MSTSFQINQVTSKLDKVSVEDLSGYVPYTGATTNVDLGAFDLTATTITGANVTSGADPGHTHGSGSITEADPIFTAWLAVPPNVSVFTNDAGYLTAEADTLASVMARGATTGIQLTSTLAIGTSPFAVTSTTLNTNLNADLLDSQEGTYYLAWANFTGTPTTLAGYGISDTKANFDTALSDGTFAFAGGAFHDGFSDFVANEHIDHTSVSISTTSPISGGGDISSNRTITTSMATNKLIGRGTAGTGVMEEITLGTNLSMTGTTLNAAGGSGTPGGADTEIQFNDAGSFGGDSNFVWAKAINRMTISSGSTDISDGTRTVKHTNGGRYAIQAYDGSMNVDIVDTTAGEAFKANDGTSTVTLCNGSNAILVVGSTVLGGTLGVAGNTTVVGTMAATTVTGANVTSGADPGHTHTTASLTTHWIDGGGFLYPATDGDGVMVRNNTVPASNYGYLDHDGTRLAINATSAGGTREVAPENTQAIDFGSASYQWQSGHFGENGIYAYDSASTTDYIRMYMSGASAYIATSANNDDLKFQVIDDTVTKTITWDANIDTLLHSAGLFTFGDKIVIADSAADILTLGNGAAGIDYQLKFDGETNDGILTWMEDEDYFQFEDGVYFPSTEGIGIGVAPDASTTLVNLDVDGEVSFFTANGSLTGDSQEKIAFGSTVDTGGGTGTGRALNGFVSTLNVNTDVSAGMVFNGNSATGVATNINVSGDKGTFTRCSGTGFSTGLSLSGDGAEGYGNQVTINGDNSLVGKYYLGSGIYIVPDNIDDEAYGIIANLSSAATLNNPSAFMIGLYTANDIGGTDANMMRWAFYNASFDTTSGKMFMGGDDTPTIWGTGYDASIDWDTAGDDNLKIDPQYAAAGHYVVLNVPKTSTGDPANPQEGMIYWNTVDNVIKMYADSGWRTLASW